MFVQKCSNFLFTNFFFGIELDQLTGIAAILRFPIADLDDEELEDEEEEDGGADAQGGEEGAK